MSEFFCITIQNYNNYHNIYKLILDHVQWCIKYFKLINNYFNLLISLQTYLFF